MEDQMVTDRKYRRLMKLMKTERTQVITEVNQSGKER